MDEMRGSVPSLPEGRVFCPSCLRLMDKFAYQSLFIVDLPCSSTCCSSVANYSSDVQEYKRVRLRLINTQITIRILRKRVRAL